MIHPYSHEGMWVFDDAAVGLVKEPFVSGADRIIDRLVEQVPDAHNGFILIFSELPFPGHQVSLEWLREECGGNVYRCNELDMVGWLCPALLQYFNEAPKQIHAEVRARGTNS
jgi:hypothetical protein